MDVEKETVLLDLSLITGTLDTAAEVMPADLIEKHTRAVPSKYEWFTLKSPDLLAAADDEKTLARVLDYSDSTPVWSGTTLRSPVVYPYYPSVNDGIMMFLKITPTDSPLSEPAFVVLRVRFANTDIWLPFDYRMPPLVASEKYKYFWAADLGENISSTLSRGDPTTTIKESSAAAVADALLRLKYPLSGELEKGQVYVFKNVGTHVFVSENHATRTIHVYDPAAVQNEATELVVETQLDADGRLVHKIKNESELRRMKLSFPNADVFVVPVTGTFNSIQLSRIDPVDILDTEGLLHRVFPTMLPGASVSVAFVGVSPLNKLPTKFSDIDSNQNWQAAHLFNQAGNKMLLSGVAVFPPSYDTKAANNTKKLVTDSPMERRVLFQHLTTLWRVKLRVSDTSLEMDKSPAMQKVFPRLRNPPGPDLEKQRKLYLQVLLAKRAGFILQMDSTVEFALKHYELIARHRNNYVTMTSKDDFKTAFLSTIAGRPSVGDFYILSDRDKYIALVQPGTLEGAAIAYDNYPLTRRMNPEGVKWDVRVREKEWTAEEVLQSADLRLLQYVEEKAGMVLHKVDGAPLLTRLLAGEILRYEDKVMHELDDHLSFALDPDNKQINYGTHCRGDEVCANDASNALRRIEAFAKDEVEHTFSVYFKEFKDADEVKAALRSEDERLLSVPSFVKILEEFLRKMQFTEDKSVKSFMDALAVLETLARCLRRYRSADFTHQRIEELYEKARALAFVTKTSSKIYDDIAEKLQVLDSLFVGMVKTWLDKLHEVTIAQRELLASSTSMIDSARDLVAEIDKDLNDSSVLSAISAWKPPARPMRIGVQFDTSSYEPMREYANVMDNRAVDAAVRAAKKPLSISDFNEILNSHYFVISTFSHNSEELNKAKLRWYLYAMLIYLGEKPHPDLPDQELLDKLVEFILTTRFAGPVRPILRLMAMAYAAADAVWKLDKDVAVQILRQYFDKGSSGFREIYDGAKNSWKPSMTEIARKYYWYSTSFPLNSIRGALYENFHENKSFSAILAGIDSVLHGYVDILVVNSVTRFHKLKKVEIFDIFYWLERVTFTDISLDPLAAVSQDTFFRPNGYDSDLPPALNTYFVAEQRPEIKETSLAAFVWKDRLKQLRTDLKQPQPPSVFTPQTNIDRILGQWTSPLIARYAIAYALRESGRSVVPIDALEEIVFALLSNPEFEPWMRTHLGAASIGADKFLGFAHVVSARFAQNVKHQRDGDAFVQVTEELAMALFNALMKQREEEVLKFGKLAESRYGYTVLQAHEFWRMAVFGARPDAYMWHPSDIAPGLSSITTTEVQQQIRALTEMDRVLDLVLKKAPPTTQTLPRIDVLHACLTFILAYLRTSPLWPTTPLFSLALGGKGDVVFYDFNGAVVPFIAGQVYNYPVWQEKEDAGMQSACLLLNQPMTKWRKQEFMRVALGLEPRKPEEPAVFFEKQSRFRQQELQLDIMLARNYVTQYYGIHGRGPLIADRALVRDYLPPQPFTMHTDATPHVYARTGKDRKWMDISPLSGLEQFINTRFPLYQKNEQYSTFDWHTFQRTYYPAELMMNNVVESRSTLQDAESETIQISEMSDKLLGRELLLPPHTPFFYTVNFLLSLKDDAWLDMMPQVVADADRILAATNKTRPTLLRQYLMKEKIPTPKMQADVAEDLLNTYQGKLNDLMTKFAQLVWFVLPDQLRAKVVSLDKTVVFATVDAEVENFRTATRNSQADEALAKRVADALEKAKAGLTAYETYLPRAKTAVDTVNTTLQNSQLDFPLYTATIPSWLSFPSGLFS